MRFILGMNALRTCKTRINNIVGDLVLGILGKNHGGSGLISAGCRETRHDADVMGFMGGRA